MSTTARDQAIAYVLNRIQTDPDVGYYCGFGTEVFRLLCVAEAEITGKPAEEVEARRRRDLQPDYRWREPENVLLRREREAWREAACDDPETAIRLELAGREAIRDGLARRKG